MTGDALADALNAIAKAITEGNKQIIEELKEVKKVAARPMDFDPTKLNASTKNVEVKVKEVLPADTQKPNLSEPWPDPRIPKPPLVRG